MQPWESVIEHYEPVNPEGDDGSAVATPRATATPWEKSIEELARG